MLLARNERDLGFMELMLARLEAKPYPLPHEVEIAHLDTSGFRATQGAAEHQQQQGVISQTGQIGGVDLIEHPRQGLQGQGSRLAFAVITEAHYAAHHLFDLRMLGRHGMNALLLEGVADPSQSPH
ncbi:hypothetical protein D3C80_1391500 [compost metagenome]